MSFVVTQQESLAAAAGDLHLVGSAMAAHNGAAADVVSALTAAQLAIPAHPAAEAVNAIAVG